MLSLIVTHRSQLSALAKHRSATSSKAFGSIGRVGDARNDGDVDLLMTLASYTSALAPGGLLVRFTKICSAAGVDVATEPSLYPALREEDADASTTAVALRFDSGRSCGRACATHWIERVSKHADAGRLRLTGSRAQPLNQLKCCRHAKRCRLESIREVLGLYVDETVQLHRQHMLDRPGSDDLDA